jgi:hypothetical protein
LPSKLGFVESFWATELLGIQVPFGAAPVADVEPLGAVVGAADADVEEVVGDDVF